MSLPGSSARYEGGEQMSNCFADRWAVTQNGGTAESDDGDIVPPDDIPDESSDEK